MPDEQEYKDFAVTWDYGTRARTPLEAAREARECMRKYEPIFSVSDAEGNITVIDMDVQEEDEGEVVGEFPAKTS